MAGVRVSAAVSAIDGASPGLRLWARAFAVGVAVHAALPDFETEGWGASRWALWLCAALLFVRPHVLLFATVCALKTYSLLMLRDVLTQSLLLAVWSGVAAVGCTIGTREAARRTLDTVRVVAGLTYLLAATHKLNTDFFDPAVSCADHAARQVATLWSLPTLVDSPVLAAGVVLWEVLLGVLVLRRSRWVWPLGLAFHLPLTVTLAPAFGAVMVAGWAAGVAPREVVLWRRSARGLRRRALLLAAGLGAAAIEALMRAAPDPLAQGKVVLAGALLAAWPRRAVRPVTRPTHRGPILVGVVFAAHGLSPYLGLRMQHTAAMLSNLRIDPECHNSLVFPALPGPGPYIYMDAIRFGPGEVGNDLRPERSRIVRETLWNPTALHVMRENWCIAELRPITVGGRWHGRRFELPDLCAPDALDALDAGDALRPGPGFLPGHQAFQKNLPRACHAACVH